MSIPEDKRRDYAVDIFTEFLILSGLPPTRCMSPLEWRVMLGWIEAGVPLRIVLRALKDTRGHGKSLAYYQAPVAQAYAMWRAAMGGHAA